MGRRKAATKSGDLVVLVALGACYWILLAGAQPSFTTGLLFLTVLLVWICLLMPTHCDYRTQRGKPCDRSVRGKLRGCRDHGRWKRDAMFAMLKLRNPGLLFRVMWSAPGAATVTTVSAGTPAQSGPSEQSAYDVVMLVLTIVSTVATVLSLFV